MKNYSQEELQDARAFIDDLRSANGGITKEEEEELDRLLPKVKEALENLQNKVGISTKMFVFFIVNADFALPESNRAWLTFAVCLNSSIKSLLALSTRLSKMRKITNTRAPKNYPSCLSLSTRTASL